MSTGLHRDLEITEIHRAYSYSYVDATARTGATGFASADLGKLAWQTDNNTFWALIATTPTWVELTGDTAGMLSIEQHKVLRQLIHFIDNGPAEGFATGAYREITGTTFPSAVIWYDKSGAGKKKIVEKLITYSGVFPNTITWKMYDATETLLVTVADTLSYSGSFETSRTRSIS